MAHEERIDDDEVLDEDDVAFAQSKYEDAATTLRETIGTYNKYKEDYKQLDGVLKTLPDRLKPQIMVPIGRLAFMPGYISKTNEITVLLGENYFAKRSAKQAREIIERRVNFLDVDIDRCSKLLQNYEKYGELTDEVISKMGNASIEVNPDGTVEIVERVEEDEDNPGFPKPGPAVVKTGAAAGVRSGTKGGATQSAADDIEPYKGTRRGAAEKEVEKLKREYEARVKGDEGDLISEQLEHMSQFLDLDDCSDTDQEIESESELDSDDDVVPRQPAVRSPADIYTLGMALKDSPGTASSASSIPDREQSSALSDGVIEHPVADLTPPPVTAAATTTASSKPVSRFKREMLEKKK